MSGMLCVVCDVYCTVYMVWCTVHVRDVCCIVYSAISCMLCWMAGVRWVACIVCYTVCGKFCVMRVVLYAVW